MSHTPGPWRIDPNTSPEAGRAIEAQAFDGSWKYVTVRVRGGSVAQSEANARLIAASPDLLNALRIAALWILKVAADHDDEGDLTGLHARAMRVHALAEAAIQKAEAQ